MTSTPDERLVYVLRDYPSLSQTFVRNEVQSLRAIGRDVHVLALRDLPAEHIPAGWGGQRELTVRLPRARGAAEALRFAVRHPVRTARMWRRVATNGHEMRWAAAWALPAIARRLSAAPTSVCHTHFAFDNAYPTLYLAALLDCPASITVHAADIYRDPAAAVELLRQFDTVVTVCEFNVHLLAEHGLPRERTVVVPCGVDLPPEAALRRESPTESSRVLSVGRFVPKKGFDVLVRAWPEVVAAVPSARLELVGDGPERERVEELVATLGVADTVRFLGARPNTEVLDLIAGADVFTLACVVPADGDSDALPVVIREAMARARPTVTTLVAGVPEALDEASGWLVAPSSPHDLAQAIVVALTDRQEATRRGQAARRRIERSATLEIAAEQLDHLFAGSRRRATQGDPR